MAHDRSPVDSGENRDPTGSMATLLRVAHVIAPQPVGGAESVVRALARAANDTGLAVEVVALVRPGPEHPFVTTLRRDGVPVIAVTCPRRRYVMQVRKLAEVLHAIHPDVVHTPHLPC